MSEQRPLPELADAIRENRDSADQLAAERMTETFNRPGGSIETAAGEMERCSPLFRGTEASPQAELFHQEKP